MKIRHILKMIVIIPPVFIIVLLPLFIFSLVELLYFFLDKKCVDKLVYISDKLVNWKNK